MDDPRHAHDHDGREPSEGDVAEQERAWEEEEPAGTRTSVPVDVPEADAAEQSRAWAQEESPKERPRIPPDVSEFDALDQERPADLDDDHDRP